MLIENQHKYSKYVNLISITTSNRQGQIHKPAIHVVACIHAKKKYSTHLHTTCSGTVAEYIAYNGWN